MGADGTGQERYRAQWLRGVIDEQGTLGGAAEDPRADAEVPDLGSGKGVVGPCGAGIDDRCPGLLRRPAQSLAARNQREHERPSASVLPEGHRSLAVDREGSRGRRAYPQHTTAEGSRMAHSRRSDGTSPTIAATAKCCDDQLNPPCDPASE